MVDILSVAPVNYYGGECQSIMDIQHMAGDAHAFSTSTMTFGDLLETDISMTEACYWGEQEDEDRMDLS